MKKIKELQTKGSIDVEGFQILESELQIIREFNGDNNSFEAAWDEQTMIILDLKIDDKMRQEGIAREVINKVQKLRKKAKIHPSDPIEVFYSINENDELLRDSIKNFKSFIVESLGVEFSNVKPDFITNIKTETFDISKSNIHISVCRLAFDFNDKSLLSKTEDESFSIDLKRFILSREYFSLLKKFSDNKGKLKITLEEGKKSVELELGKDIFRSTSEKLAQQKA